MPLPVSGAPSSVETLSSWRKKPVFEAQAGLGPDEHHPRRQFRRFLGLDF